MSKFNEFRGGVETGFQPTIEEDREACLLLNADDDDELLALHPTISPEDLREREQILADSYFEREREIWAEAEAEREAREDALIRWESRGGVKRLGMAPSDERAPDDEGFGTYVD